MDRSVPKSDNINTIELLFHEKDLLGDLSTSAKCLPETVISLAWGVVLKTFYHTDSVCVILDDDEDYRRLYAQTIPQDIRVLEYLEGVGDQRTGQNGERNIDQDGTQQFVLSSKTQKHEPEEVSQSERQYTKSRRSTSLHVLQDEISAAMILQIRHEPNSLPEWKARSMLSATRCALRHIVDQPSTLIRDIELVDDVEEARLRDWSQRVPIAIERCVHDMIRERALAHPDAIAVDAWDGSFTYSELDMAAQTLAYTLIQQGVGPEKTVGLYFEKSKWYTVALLAVLKAGGAFVPLDPSQPMSRLSYIVTKTGAGTVITSPTHAEAAERLCHSSLVLSEAWMVTMPQLKPNPVSAAVRPWNLAYIMFTSGSTGNPKGVMIEHSACCSSATHHGRATHMSTRSRSLQFARHTFDASIAEIITTLINGGCIVVPSEEEKLNDIANVVRTKQVNWMFATPALLRLLEPSEMTTVEMLIVGGEAVAQDLVRKWAPGRTMYLACGPTENTVFSNFHPVSPLSPSNIIGRGVGSVCWVTDSADPSRLLPPGSIGELLLEGPQVARGYLGYGEGEGPNAAFIKDPPWLVKLGRRGRLYRSGDLCYFDENGVAYIVGRKDTQLKIAGQRLEAKDVESNLAAAVGTNDVVVDVIDRPGQASGNQSQLLVAYICLSKGTVLLDGSKCITSEPNRQLLDMLPGIESNLSQSLPHWMQPSVFLPIIAVPLNPSGKVDLKRLRKEVAAMSSEEFNSFMPVASADDGRETEQCVVMKDLWTETLGMSSSSISSNSHFFRSGGDSIVAMKLVAAARKRGLQLTVAGILNNPILGDQAQLMIAKTETFQEMQPFALIEVNEDLLREVGDECAVHVDTIEDAYPCTPLQEGLFALSAAQPGAYFAQHVLTLPGHVDIEKLKFAWEAVFQAHSMLRTRLVQTIGQGILQVVLREVLQWHEDSDLERYLQLDQTHIAESGKPLNQFAVVYDSIGNASRLVWTAHHAVTDGHSVALTIQHVREAYEIGQSIAGSPFSTFVRHITQTSDTTAGQFWHEKFLDFHAPSFPKLPQAAYSPKPKSYVRRTMSLDTKNLDVTTTTVLRAAWAMVIGIFSGSDDVAFGVTSTGRSDGVNDLDSLCGPTIATVPLRLQCKRDITVANLLAATQQYAIDMIPYEQTGLSRIGRIGEDCRTACDFQSIMIVQPEADMSPDGSCFSGYHRPQDLDCFNAYAIMLECNLEYNKIRLNINYDSVVIENDQMVRLVDYFEAAVHFLLLGSERHVGDFSRDPIPQDIEKMWEWNSTPFNYESSCVHHLFEQQACSQPQGAAIFAHDGSMDFAELDNKASQLARMLQDKGVSIGDRVPYCFEKSMYTVVAMLAILKAGASIVALDPKHPRDRHQHIVKAVKASVILTSAISSRIFVGSDLEVIAVDQGCFEALRDSNVKPFTNSTMGADTPATVLFTSGSTGTPKGVVQSHATLTSAASAHAECLGLSQSSRILQLSAHVFDVSVIEIISALVLGACICIPSDEDKSSDLAGFINKSKADWAFITPSFARTLDPGELSTVKTVVFGGEAVPQELVEVWAPHIEVFNGFGPAEASICVAGNLVDGSTRTDSIGKGVNCRTWIVDPQDHELLMPIGAIGELLVQGPSIADGYLGDPERTAQSFIASPSWGLDLAGCSSVVYKTGDLARYHPDGSLVYLGRKDNQVKIRGQRVELEEIEHYMMQILPENSLVAVDAIVMPGHVDRSLVAFLKLGNVEDGDFSIHARLVQKVSDSLRAELNKSLPVYMVPQVYLPVIRMPLTTTGKLDRRALKYQATSLSLDDLQQFTSTSDSITTSEVLRKEETIARDISNRIAELQSVNDKQYGARLRNRDFNPYQAGLDSIQVISLATYVRKRYEVSLPIAKYMDSKASIRDIAEWITVQMSETVPDGAGASDLQLLEEVEKYDEQIYRLPLAHHSTFSEDLETTFLTGATGFLGSHILRQLLQRSKSSKVIALVRGRNAQHAQERLYSLCQVSDWWRDEYRNRVEIWHGDLSKPKLGMSSAQWDRLCAVGTATEPSVDAIIHNGAVVYWMADYEALKAANISSTVQLLNATAQASQRRPVKFTYVSGGHLSTAPDVVEDIAEELLSYPAYSQTKFVAEVLVKKYAERLAATGMSQSVSIIKPGLVMGSSEDGIANTDDFLWRVVASSLDVGSYNGSEGEQWVAAAGADLVSQIIVDRCIRPDNNVTHKVLNGLKVGEFWEVVCEETGLATNPVDVSTWMSALREAVDTRGETHQLFPVFHVLEEKRGMLGQPLNDMSPYAQHDQQGSVRTSLRKSLQYLKAIGYLHSTRAHSSSSSGGSSPHGHSASLLSPGTPVFGRTATTPSWERQNSVNVYEKALLGLAEAQKQS